MNIFVLNPSPSVSAFTLWATDKFMKHRRPKKMLVEACQLLSNALYEQGFAYPYKPTHLHHPCSLWTRERGYKWLYVYALFLNDLYEISTGKKHKGWEKCLPFFSSLPKEIADTYPEPDAVEFVNCTPYKDLPVFEAYKKHLQNKVDSELEKSSL